MNPAGYGTVVVDVVGAVVVVVSAVVVVVGAVVVVGWVVVVVGAVVVVVGAVVGVVTGSVGAGVCPSVVGGTVLVDVDVVDAGVLSPSSSSVARMAAPRPTSATMATTSVAISARRRLRCARSYGGAA